jgi:hypothetical protein
VARRDELGDLRLRLGVARQILALAAQSGTRPTKQELDDAVDAVSAAETVVKELYQQAE